ncbi:MAG TPA: SigE family RNA polymerase sigma factor [Nocardioidaceae bacterium]|nr:SigE family RNA polymerase sigma factor [Nocardioidaceae bacterium]
MTALVKGAPAHAGTADLKGPPSMSSPTTWDADEAVTSLYAAHYRSLVRMAALLLRDGGEAEEVVQDAFVAMHDAWRRLRDADRALAYLRQSVVNRARSALRRRAVRERHATEQGREPPHRDLPSAESEAMRAEDRRAVVDALRTLPERQREAIVLRYYADLSEADTAFAMGVSRGAVKSHTSRGMAALRTNLERQSW